MKKLLLMTMIGIFTLGILPSLGETNTIAKGSKVAIDYTLTVDGEIIDSSKGKKPLEYIQGDGMIIPGLERSLEGLKANDSKEITIAPTDAYGNLNENLMIEIPKENIGTQFEPQVGMILEMTGPQGQPMPGKIAEIKKDSLILDFNHPLAGKELTFTVTIVSVN